MVAVACGGDGRCSDGCGGDVCGGSPGLYSGRYRTDAVMILVEAI